MFDGSLILIRSLVERGVQWIRLVVREFYAEPEGWNEKPAPKAWWIDWLEGR